MRCALCLRTVTCTIPCRRRTIKAYERREVNLEGSEQAEVPAGGAALEAGLDPVCDPAARAADMDRFLDSLDELTAEGDQAAGIDWAAEQQRTSSMSFRQLMIDALDGADPFSHVLAADYVPVPLHVEQPALLGPAAQPAEAWDVADMLRGALQATRAAEAAEAAEEAR